MAMSRQTRDFAYRGIFAHLSAGTPEADIIDRVMNKYTTIKDEDRGQMRTLLRSAISAHRAAGELEAGTRGAGDIAGIPIDWSDTGQPGRFRYRVLISVVDPGSGESYDTLVIVHSRTTLDRADVIQSAQESAQLEDFEARYPTRTDYTSPAVSTTYQVVGIGRTP